MRLFESMRLLACLGVWLTVQPAQASTMRFVPLRQLVKTADAVVMGHATRRASFWQGTRIYTLVQVDVDEVWTGKAPHRQIEVLTLGGVVGDIGQNVEGAAQLPQDRRLVLHLRSTATGEYQTVAMAQGVWIVAPEPTEPDPSRRVHTQASPLVSRRVDRLVGATSADALPTTLAALKQAVMEAAHAP